MFIHRSLVALYAVATLACSAAEDRAPGAAQNAEPEPLPFGAPSAIKCTDGEMRTCRNTIKETAEDGVTDCFVGVQLCEGGAWGECRSDRAVIAAARTCTVDTLDISRLAMKPIEPAAFARAWASVTKHNGAPIARFKELNGLSKIEIGGGVFDIGLSDAHGFTLTERAVAIAIDEIPFVAMRASGALNAECTAAASATITLTIPESAGSMTLAGSTIDELFGGASDYNGVRGYRFTLTTESK
jgi:hypothetical protein